MLKDYTYLLSQKSLKFYGGANGSKKSVNISGNLWILKMPHTAGKNIEIHYTNDIFSEYICCHIFNYAGIRAQETMLGKIRDNGKEKAVVFCRDFEDQYNARLYDFAMIKNRIFGFPKSVFKDEHGKIGYKEMFEKNISELNNALTEIYPEIVKAMPKAYRLIDDIDEISQTRKTFYKTMLNERKEKIIDYWCRHIGIPAVKTLPFADDGKAQMPKKKKSSNNGKPVSLNRRDYDDFER